MMKYLFILFLIAFGIKSNRALAQDDGEKVRILFIFDCSNSMRAQWQKSSKEKIAKKLMLQTLDSLQGVENIELALRLYGHQTKIAPNQQDCNDTELVVPFAPARANVTLMKDKLRSATCQGTTPIALSLEEAGNNDFPPCDNCRNVIILISDGVEACDGDPCAVARALHKNGIKLKPFIIGIGLDTSYLGEFQCIGEFLSADTEDSFKNVMSYVISQAVNNTTVQVNLNDIKGNPKETDVTMSFYNQKSGALVETFMHTLNVKQLPDTLALNPLFTYKLVVHTTPEIVKENIKIKPGTHTVIDVDAPQGFLKISVRSNPTAKNDIQCIIRKSGEMNTINIQQMNTSHKYLVGKYDLELLTLPRTYIDNVKIEQGRTYKVQIRQSGYVTITKREGPCQIFVLKDGEEQWVCNVPESITPSTVKLLPGKYKVVFRKARNISAANTIEKEFTIVPGDQEFIEF